MSSNLLVHLDVVAEPCFLNIISPHNYFVVYIEYTIIGLLHNIITLFILYSIIGRDTTMDGIPLSTPRDLATPALSLPSILYIVVSLSQSANCIAAREFHPSISTFLEARPSPRLCLSIGSS